jgi:hypothetical protein
MKLAQRKIKWLARLMLGLVLFAQGIVAANACVTTNVSPARVYVAMNEDEATPCHQEKDINANACLSHCTQLDQISLDQHNTPLAAPSSVIAWVFIQPQAQRICPAATPERQVLNTGPPIPIRFCSFLI